MAKKLKDENVFTGVVEDPRTLEEKELDYQAEEIASYTPPVWQNKGQNDWPRYDIRNQDGSFSCVAQTLALMLGIENLREEGRFITASAADIYDRRKNKPGGGMWGVDALSIASDFGATLETFMPSQNMSEAEIMNIDRKVSDEQMGLIFKGGGYVQHPFDIERIASYMEANRKNGVAKPVMTWYRFNYQEWTGEPKDLGLPKTVHHSVTAIDYGIYKGKKVLITQDSWGHHTTTFDGLRLIDQEFIDKHMTFCASLHDLSNDWRNKVQQDENPEPLPEPSKPGYNFTRQLKYGETSRDVAALQDILKYEGLFPANVESTGRYLQITAKSVLAWQKKHKVASDAELNYLQGRVCGPKTIKKLNELY